MSTAALLPTIGDPLLLNLWLKSYEKVWKDEVDSAYMLITSDVEKPVRDWIISRAQDVGWNVSAVLPVLQHGTNIATLLNTCEEDNIVLLEDDVFILQPGHIKACFDRLESGEIDCIGSTRLSSTPGIVKRQNEIFNLSGWSPEHAISECPHLWPSLFFTKRETLLRTDQNFCACNWGPGTYLAPLDWTTTEVECGDTFVWTSMELRAMGCMFDYIHQYHAGPNDITDMRYKKGLFGFPVPWVHFGSLSSGICDMLRYENNIPLANSGYSGPDLGPSPTEATINRGAMGELCRRVSMYNLVSKHGRLPESKFRYYNNIYERAVERSCNRMNLDMSLVSQFLSAYECLLKPILD